MTCSYYLNEARTNLVRATGATIECVGPDGQSWVHNPRAYAEFYYRDLHPISLAEAQAFARDHFPKLQLDAGTPERSGNGELVPEVPSDFSAFVNNLLDSLPIKSMTARDIPAQVAHLYDAPDATWIVFSFAPPDACAGEDAANLQYAVEGGVVGLEWVLRSSRNIKDESKVSRFIREGGLAVRRCTLNGVDYLRVEGDGIEQLGLQIITKLYGLPADRRLGFIDSLSYQDNRS